MVGANQDSDQMQDTLGEQSTGVSLNRIIKELRGPDTAPDYVRLLDILAAAAAEHSSGDSNDDRNAESEDDDRAGLIEHHASSSEDEEHISIIAM